MTFSLLTRGTNDKLKEFNHTSTTMIVFASLRKERARAAREFFQRFNYCDSYQCVIGNNVRSLLIFLSSHGTYHRVTFVRAFQELGINQVVKETRTKNLIRSKTDITQHINSLHDIFEMHVTPSLNIKSSIYTCRTDMYQIIRHLYQKIQVKLFYREVT